MEKQYIEERDGGYWVAGARISLDSLVFAFQERLSPETIATEYFPTLTLEQVYGAIAYYLGHQEEIDEYLSSTDAEFEALRRTTQNADPAFHEKLVQARRQLTSV